MNRRGIFGVFAALVAQWKGLKPGPLSPPKGSATEVPIGLPDYTENVVETIAGKGTAQALTGIPGLTTAFVAWPSGGLALIIPFTLDNAETLYGFGAICGGVGGNLDIGVYDAADNLLASWGGKSLTSSRGHLVALSIGPAGKVLIPGKYSFVISSDSNAITLLCAQLQPGLNDLLVGSEASGGYPITGHLARGFNDTRNMVPLICGVWGDAMV